ncbi:MAG: XRE family transcriptional regulator, partial [Pseudonocardiaceae bacterium]
MAEANDQLRTARQRTASLTSPDVCLSRQELAELVNAWAWAHHEKTLEHSANWVGQLESGKIRWPGKVSREALRAILSVPTDAALGFVNARSARAAVKLEKVDRQQFLRTSRNLGVVFGSWGITYGGEVVRDAAMSQLRWSADLLGAACPDRLRPELRSALGDLAAVAGYLAQGAGDHEQARRVYRFARACAEQAGD